jgi:hypothetical protein
MSSNLLIGAGATAATANANVRQQLTSNAELSSSAFH